MLCNHLIKHDEGRRHPERKGWLSVCQIGASLRVCAHLLHDEASFLRVPNIAKIAGRVQPFEALAVSPGRDVAIPRDPLHLLLDSSLTFHAVTACSLTPGTYNPAKLFGVTTLDVVRAEAFIAEILGVVSAPCAGSCSRQLAAVTRFKAYVQTLWTPCDCNDGSPIWKRLFKGTWKLPRIQPRL